MAINEGRIFEEKKELSDQFYGGTDTLGPIHYPVYEESSSQGHGVDVLSQLNSNIDQLEKLQKKLGFMMSEVRSLIKK